MTIRYIDEIPLEGKKIFIRADLNVPLDDQRKITDDTRIREVLPTVSYALRHGEGIVMCSHLGRPKGKRDDKYSLTPVAQRMSELLGRDVIMAPDVISDGVKLVASQLKAGQILLLENLRFNPGETANDPAFAAELASTAQIYINDAFGSCHRAHASVEEITRHFEVVAGGFLLRKELKYFGRVLSNPDRPFIAILGGAKVSDKIGVIENLLNKVDAILIGGGMAYTFLKQMGINVGKSIVELDKLPVAEKVLQLSEEKSVKLLLPTDSVCADKIAADAQVKICSNTDIPPYWMALDIGPKTLESFKEQIKGAGTIVWNGPMGVFEIAPFAAGTFGVAQAMAASNAMTIVGGGDSVAAVHAAGVADKISHISTGGGASLELLEGKTLPGVAALDR